jgi:hypothetical protein
MLSVVFASTISWKKEYWTVKGRFLPIHWLVFEEFSLEFFSYLKGRE